MNSEKTKVERTFEMEIFNETKWALKLIPLSKSALGEIPTKVTNNVRPEFSPEPLTELIAEFKPGLKSGPKLKPSKAKIALIEERVKDSFGDVIIDSPLRWKDIREYLNSYQCDFPMDQFVDMEKGIDLLFIGEKLENTESPHLLSSSSELDLMGKMIRAMEIPQGKFIRRLISSGIDYSKSPSLKTDLVERIAHEILFLRPRVVVCMGATAVSLLMGKKERLSRIHGQIFNSKVQLEGREDIEFSLVPIFHPDFLEINPSMKRTAWLDLQVVMKILAADKKAD